MKIKLNRSGLCIIFSFFSLDNLLSTDGVNATSLSLWTYAQSFTLILSLYLSVVDAEVDDEAEQGALRLVPDLGG